MSTRDSITLDRFPVWAGYPRRLRARSALLALVFATSLPTVGCGTASPSGERATARAAPGFKGKDCKMVSPDLNPDLSRPGKTATVKARAYFVNGEVESVKILSGPAAYHQPVIEAMKQYQCAGHLTFVADQKFVFGVDPLSRRLGR